MMDWLATLVLGVIQGLVEFIPVSSSGHLVVVSELIEAPTSFEFAVFVNIGTLIALLIYWQRRWRALNRQLIIQLIGATLPAIVVGYFWLDFWSSLSDHLLVVVIALAAGGLIMVWVDQPKRPAINNLTELGWGRSLIVGLGQVLAFIPGASRSGVTILTGLGSGLSRQTAVDWSFLLALPVISGALVRVSFSDDGQAFLGDHWEAVVVGNLISLIVGLGAIWALVRIIKNHSLRPFGYYRLLLAAGLLGLCGLGILSL